MADIQLTPEILMSQSSQMDSLQAEYESLFSRVTSALNSVNECWSEAIAGNFSGKISGAQKDFSSIANMLTNGAAAAKLTALTMDHGGTISGTLSALLGGGSVASLLSGQSDLATWINEHADEIGKGGADMIGELSGLGTDHAETIESVVQKMAAGDYEGALSEAGDKLIDYYADAMSGGVGSSDWVSRLDEETGGALSLGNLPKSYFKNWLKSAGENAVNIVTDQYSDNPDYGYELSQLGEFAWNSTAGAVIRTGGDAAYNVVSQIPIVGDYYTSRGATDSEGALGVMLHDMTYAVTGDSSAADYTGSYYQNHGGVASGVVDGIVDIGDYLWHNVLGK